MRTEEKKREKERQSAALTPAVTTPAEHGSTPVEAAREQEPVDQPPVEVSEATAPAEAHSVEASNEAPVVDASADTDAPGPAEPVAEVGCFDSILIHVQGTDFFSPSSIATPKQMVITHPTLPQL